MIQGREPTLPFPGRGGDGFIRRSALHTMRRPRSLPSTLPPPGGTWYGPPAPGRTHKTTLQGAGGRTPNPQSQHHRATPPQEAAGETALLPSLPSLLRGWKRRGGGKGPYHPSSPRGGEGTVALAEPQPEPGLELKQRTPN